MTHLAAATEIGHRLCRLRAERGCSAAFVARKVNVAQASVCRWELGHQYPQLELAFRLAAFYGVSVEELFGGDGV